MLPRVLPRRRVSSLSLNIHLHVKFDWNDSLDWYLSVVQAGAGVECSLFSFSILFVTHVVTHMADRVLSQYLKRNQSTRGQHLGRRDRHSLRRGAHARPRLQARSSSESVIAWRNATAFWQHSCRLLPWESGGAVPSRCATEPRRWAQARPSVGVTARPPSPA